MQNYPNPVSGTTVIEYTLPAAAHVTLSILDIRGNVITRLASGEQQAGRHSIPFSTAGLAAGVYFYKLEAGRFSTVKQMQVVR